MTTEEIEKAIERFTEERRHKSTDYPPKEWFKAGAEFADKHWQEKTRWVPVEERLPKPLPFEDVGEIANGDLLLVKHIGYGSIEFGVLREANNVKYWELPDCGNLEINEISHWKEIE